jgi:Wiskott-Aldrich syndrome protein
MSPEERKAKLLAAKAEYKVQKAMYRAERQAKRMKKPKSKTPDVDVAEAAARVASLNVDVDSSAGPANQPDPLLISQGRGQFPSLEMVSVPRRHHTISGGTVRGSRHGREASGSTNQTATIEVRRARVVRKLFDMGFEGAKVENRVSIHIPDGQTIEDKSEDVIVTNVVNELLQSEGDGANESPSTPRAN